MTPPDFVERLAESMLCDCGLGECVPRRRGLAFLRAVLLARPVEISLLQGHVTGCPMLKGDDDCDCGSQHLAELLAWAEADESEELG